MLAFLKSEFQKEGFKSWITVYLFATLTLLAVQYNWASELVKFVSFVYFVLIFLSQTEGIKIVKPWYHMHVFFDLIFGLGIASLFFYFELYAHVVVVFAITLLDVFFTKRQKEKTNLNET